MYQRSLFNRYHNIEQILLQILFGVELLCCDCDEQNINFVSNEKNQQTSLVETVWQFLEEKVYVNGWKAKVIDQLKRRI